MKLTTIKRNDYETKTLLKRKANIIETNKRNKKKSRKHVGRGKLKKKKMLSKTKQKYIPSARAERR